MATKKHFIAKAIVATVGIIADVGAIHHLGEFLARIDQYEITGEMLSTIQTEINKQKPEALQELRTQMQTVFTSANKEYQRLCEFVDRKSENMNVEDYLTPAEIECVEKDAFSEVDFSKMSHKAKEAAILYRMQLIINYVEIYSNVDEKGFSALNSNDSYNYYTNSNYDVNGYDRQGY